MILQTHVKSAPSHLAFIALGRNLSDAMFFLHRVIEGVFSCQE